MKPETLQEIATDAMGYWEPRRIIYNLMMVVIVLWCFLLAWPLSREAINLDDIIVLFILAVIANVAYCAAYVVDLFVPVTRFRDQKRRWRLAIALIGFAFAAALTRFCAVGIAKYGGNP